MNREHDDALLELASLRAIDALEAAEAAVIDAHLQSCTRCRDEFARSRAAGTALALSASSPAPVHLRNRVLAAAVRVRLVRPWYLRGGVGASIAAALVVVAVSSWLLTHRAPATLQWAAHCTPIAIVDCGTVVASGGSLRLDARGLPALPAGKIYQAWIIPPKHKPIPEPTFAAAPDGTATVTFPSTPERGALLAVTEEPTGGSKAPTSKPVLIATLM